MGICDINFPRYVIFSSLMLVLLVGKKCTRKDDVSEMFFLTSWIEVKHVVYE